MTKKDVTDAVIAACAAGEFRFARRLAVEHDLICCMICGGPPVSASDDVSRSDSWFATVRIFTCSTCACASNDYATHPIAQLAAAKMMADGCGSWLVYLKAEKPET